MDYLVPMIYWNMPDPKPNYNELVDDFIKGIGKEHLIGGQRLRRPGEGQATEHARRQQSRQRRDGCGGGLKRKRP